MKTYCAVAHTLAVITCGLADNNVSALIYTLHLGLKNRALFMKIVQKYL
jgi:hypothetical protein